MRRAALVAAVVAGLGASGASAQFAPGARTVGMGGGGIVFASGVDAVELNPANLATHQGWHVSLFEVGGASLLTGATFSELAAVFGADVLGSSDHDVAQIVQGLPDDGIGFSLVAEGYALSRALEAGDVPSPGAAFPALGLSVGPFGLRMRSRVTIDATLSKELADLIGNGYSESRIQEYAVGNTGFREVAYSEILGSYGTTVGGLLGVGAGLRYVKGHSLLDGRFFEPVLDLVSDPRTLSVTSVAVGSDSGSGWGLDFGLSLDLPMGFRVSASGANVIQRMNWDETLTAHTATYTNDEINDSDFIDLIDTYEAEVVDPNSVSLPVLQAAEELFEESYFPATWRGGVGFQTGGTTLEVVGISVSPRGRQRTSWDERVSLGIEQRIPVLTLRAGIARAQDGVQALTGGLGFRMGPVHLDTAGGYFGGDDEPAGVYEGYYGTISLQIRGGGSR